jgi:hypothetical protein
MTTTAVVDEMPDVGLSDSEHEYVGNGHPDCHAPNEAHEQPDVEAVTAVVGSRLHDVTVLSILAATQLLWIAALGYGLLELLE